MYISIQTAISFVVFTGACQPSCWAHLQEFVELAQLVSLSAQLGDGLHCVSDDADLICAAGLPRVQQLAQLVKAAIQIQG